VPDVQWPKTACGRQGNPHVHALRDGAPARNNSQSDGGSVLAMAGGHKAVHFFFIYNHVHYSLDE
jgi:hypothetical protein